MEKEFWISRWKNRATGWQQDEVEPALMEWASKLKPTRILVPLCGKSLDLVWLRDQGFEVIGIELSPEACSEFFAENNILYEQKTESSQTVYLSKGITLFNADFFQITPEQIGIVGAVYDRAALIALPEKMRIGYASHLKKLLHASIDQPGFQFLQVLLTRKPHDEEGPPHSVPYEELKKLYGDQFHENLISREAVIARAPEGSKSFESVILLTRTKL